MSKKNKGKNKAAEPTVAELEARAAELKAALKAKAKADKKTRKAVEVAVEVAEVEVVVEDDASIKARVKAKRAARDLAANPDAVDRGDKAAVDAYNAATVLAGGHMALLTATADLEAEVAKASKPRTKAEPVQVAEVVELEVGREFAVGAEPVAEPVAVDEFATPADAPPVVEFDGLGRYKIFNPATGKSKGYTRVTTYIDCLEDKGALDKWKLRTLLEGAALNALAVGKGDLDNTTPDYFLSLVSAEVHKRDVGVAKAAKADRKGKLAPGERAIIVEALERDFKSALDAIARQALDLGGAHEKAQKGTDLHALCEVYDLEGMAAVEAKLDAGEISPADLADVVAYANLLADLGIKILEVEQMVVHDGIGLAGRLDRIAMVKLPGMQRAVRLVLDIKTGRIDYAMGKIAMQLDAYATAQGYDPAAPKERRDLKVSKTKALLLHLPAGKGEAAAYVVDLTLGHKGNRLAGDVRAWRNEGKRAIDLKAPLALLAS